VPTYNSVISRSDVQALVPEQVSTAMLASVAYQSAALSLFRRVPMSTNQTRMPVLAALPIAYFVGGDTGLKQTTKAAWDNKFLNVEEIAAIVPIPEAVLDDATFDAWGSVQPLLEAAIAQKLDAAVLFGVTKPASWPTDIVTAARAAGNEIDRGSATAAEGGIVEDFNMLYALVEEGGFTPNGVIARTAVKARLRGARDTTGQALADLSAGTIWGDPLRFVVPGGWPTAASGAAEAIAGDFNQAILGVRQDITYKVLDQASLTDDAGVVIFNLPQQDMVALRVVARYAYQVANPINYEQPSEAARFPFAVLSAP